MACCLLVVTGMVKGDGRVLLGAVATNLAWEILLGDQYQNMLARKLLGAIYFAEEACYLSKGISLALIVVGRPLIS
jgi:hypothetical protein